MAEENNSTLAKWFKENSWNLLVTVFLIGGAYGTMEVKNNARDASLALTRVELEKSVGRVEAIEKQIIGITIQQGTDHNALQGLTNDAKQLQTSVSEIKAQVDVVNNKLDNISTELHRLGNKIDTNGSRIDDKKN